MSDLLHRLRTSDTRDAGRPWSDMHEAADEIERLRELKTPASTELLNLTKSCLENAEAEVKRLRADIDALTTATNAEATEVEQLRPQRDALLAAAKEVVSSISQLGLDGWSDAPYLAQTCCAAIKLAEGK